MRVSIPKAPWPKRHLHTLYLVQPVLHFFALVAILALFSRCSPLAGSTGKEGALASAAPASHSQSQATDNKNINDAQEEAAVPQAPEKSETVVADTKVMSEQESPSAPRDVTIDLTREQMETLVRDRQLDLPVASDTDAILSWAENYQPVDNGLGGASFLLLFRDGATKNEYAKINLPVTVTIQMQGNNIKAFTLNLDQDAEQKPENAKLNSALDSAKQIAILLE